MLNRSLVLTLIAVMFSITSSYAQAKKQVVDKIIAKVDNYIALKSELDLAYLDMSQQQDGRTNSNVDRCEVLRQVLQNKMMLAKAEIDSITVSDAQVSAELDNRLRYMVQQLGSEEEIEAYYNKPLSQFKAELRDKMREQLLVREVTSHITRDVEVTPSEVKRFFSQIPADQIPFFSTEVTVGHIVKMPEVSKEQKENVRKRLNEIRDQIVNGETTFAEMARKHSEDPGSAANGGELGFWKRGELAPEYEATSLKMRPGDISRPVETQFGFHIIQLIERRGNTFNTRHILMRPSSSELDIAAAEHYLDSLRTEIVEGRISFSKAAKEYSGDQQTQTSGGYFLDTDGSTRIPVNELDPSVFFVIDTMQTGTITKPMAYRTQNGDDAVRIIYYQSKVKPHRANLRDDYQKIQAAALSEKRNKVVSKWFEEAVNDVYIDIDKEFEYCNILN